MFMSTKFLFVAASIGSALAAPAWPRQVAPQTAVSGTAVASAAGPTFTPGGLDNPPPVGSFLSIGHSAQSINRASLTATATTGCIRGVVSCLGADIVTCGDDGTLGSNITACDTANNKFCFALPLPPSQHQGKTVNIDCTTPDIAAAAIAATGASGGIYGTEPLVNSVVFEPLTPDAFAPSLASDTFFGRALQTAGFV